MRQSGEKLQKQQQDNSEHDPRIVEPVGEGLTAGMSTADIKRAINALYANRAAGQKNENV